MVQLVVCLQSQDLLRLCLSVDVQLLNTVDWPIELRGPNICLCTAGESPRGTSCLLPAWSPSHTLTISEPSEGMLVLDD